MIPPAKEAARQDELRTSLGVEEKIVGYITAAARLRMEIDPLTLDRADAAKDRTIYYAADANVARLFMSPDRVGPVSSDGGNGYGTVFPDDDVETSVALGAALSRYIFWHLTGSTRPVLLLPSHAAEIRTIYNRVADNAKGEHLKVDRAHLRTILTRIVAAKEPKERLEVLESSAPALTNALFYKRGPRSELDRLHQLINEGRILRLPNESQDPFAPYGGQLFSKEDREALAPPNELAELLEETRYRLSWEQRLRSASYIRKHKVRALSADSAALARIEFINRRLFSRGNRLVLITGDATMFRAASNYFPSFVPNDMGRDFADLYLRNPRAYLATPEVLTPRSALDEPKDASLLAPLEDWLDTLLAGYTSDSGINAQSLRDLVAPDATILASLRQVALRALRTDPTAADSIKSDWEAHTSNIVARHIAYRELLLSDATKFVAGISVATIDSALLEIDQALFQASEETWNAFFTSLMRTGFEFAPSATAKPRRRDPPPLSFDSFVHTTKFVRTILRTSGLTELSSEEFGKLLSDLDLDEPTGYAKALAYAVLFAHSGRWHVAMQIADRASEIANRAMERVAARELPLSADHHREALISGREAFYFRAVSHRLRSRSLDDLASATDFLSKAEEAHQLDCQRNPQLKPLAVRFTSERWAIHLARCLFRELIFSKENSNSDVVDPAEVMSAIVDLLPTVLNVADEWLRHRIHRNLLTNFFMAAALLDHRQIRPHLGDQLLGRPRRSATPLRMQLPVHPKFDLCKDVLMQLEPVVIQEVETNGRDPNVSRLARAVVAYAISRFSSPDSQIKTRLLAAVRHLERDLDNDSAALTVTAYDSSRYRLLAGLTKLSLA
ncbi:MAG: hypothetical protein AAB403_09280 [Planctomycetota bacterium]